jgi:hypothetical protein
MKTLFILILGLSSALIGCARHRAAKADSYPYTNPLTSPGAKFAGLPPAVQGTVRSQVGAADMYDILKSRHGDQVVYEIIFSDGRIFPPLYVRSDGSVLYPDLRVAVPAGRDDIGALSGGAGSGMKLTDLPIKVVNTIQEKAPTAEVAFINKFMVEDKTFYEVSFKDSQVAPPMMIAEDGSLVKTSARPH